MVVVNSVGWYGSQAASVKEGVISDLLVGGFGGFSGGVFPWVFWSWILFYVIVIICQVGSTGVFMGISFIVVVGCRSGCQHLLVLFQ